MGIIYMPKFLNITIYFFLNFMNFKDLLFLFISINFIKPNLKVIIKIFKVNQTIQKIKLIIVSVNFKDYFKNFKI